MGNFLLYSRRNCPYFYIGGELKKVNFTLQVSPEKINKEKAKKRIQNIKEMWNNIDVLIVEGEHTRFGVGNDLLANAKSVERIICPDKNAFNKYDNIFKSKLIDF